MERSIIESKYPAPPWQAGLGQPAADRLLQWEQRQADELLADVFGYHAVQLGWPQLDTLRANRMPHHWLAQPEFEPGDPLQIGAHLQLDSRAWPWSADSLDLVVLPHALERSADPHACLREVARVLIPEGQVLITGLNPMSAWGLQQSRYERRQPTPSSALIGYRRLRDWLRLLGFEVQVSRFGGWTPALGRERWMQRLSWMEPLGQRWWPIFGGVYLILATKRVPGVRLLEGRRWRAVRSPAPVTVPLARSDPPSGRPAASKDLVESR